MTEQTRKNLLAIIGDFVPDPLRLTDITRRVTDLLNSEDTRLQSAFTVDLSDGASDSRRIFDLGIGQIDCCVLQEEAILTKLMEGEATTAIEQIAPVQKHIEQRLSAAGFVGKQVGALLAAKYVNEVFKAAKEVSDPFGKTLASFGGTESERQPSQEPNDSPSAD